MPRRRVHHPWYFEVEFANKARLRWEEGKWSGAKEYLQAVQRRIDEGEPVDNAPPSAFPPDHWLSVQPLIVQVVGRWERVVAENMPDPPWFDDPPGLVY